MCRRNIIAVTMLFAGMSIIAAERGRVVIRNSTVCSDRGNPLRFAHLEFGITSQNTDPSKEPTWSKTYAATKTSQWDDIRNHGLNGVRVVIWRIDEATRPDGAAYFTWLDKYVSWASSRGMYVCIDYHHKPGNRPKWDDWYRFWKDVAPRYKDHTHVLYEAANEPVAWLPSQYSATDRKLQGDMYAQLRAWAPKTHLTMWSYANLDNPTAAIENAKAASGISYSNASVGFHWYKASKKNVVAVQAAGYPLICTEFTGEYGSDPPGKDSDERKANIIKECESIGLSWFVWAMQRPSSNFPEIVKMYNVTWCPEFGTWPKSCISGITAAGPIYRNYRRPVDRTAEYRFDGARIGAGVQQAIHPAVVGGSNVTARSSLQIESIKAVQARE